MTGTVLEPTNLPVVSGENSLQSYLQEIRRFPLLTKEEEFMLAKRWKEHTDRQAAHKLVTSHLRLVARIAMGYRGYGLPVSDMIAEGNIGMMHAVRRFDPDRGFRLATYAIWWVKAAIQEYVLRSWSLVKLGTTASQKKLFFNLRKIKSRLRLLDDAEMHDEDVTTIATELAVPERDVRSMNRRMTTSDRSLDAPVSGYSSAIWSDWLDNGEIDPEEQYAEAEESSVRTNFLQDALATLSERERKIIKARRLSDPSSTLEVLSGKFGVSRERIRQIENRAFEKLRAFMRDHASEMGTEL